MNKKNFSDIFQSYFHGKYSFEDFLNTQLQENINFKINTFSTYSFISYIKDHNKQLVEESQKLKNFHTFLNNILFKYMEVSASVYSYKPNKSIYDCVSLHAKSKYYFKTDIKNFFHSIDSELILKCLEKNIDNYPISSDIKEYFENIMNLIVYENSLPVGFVTSPNISNAVLYEFDKTIEKYCLTNNIIYSRYSDDLIFSCDNKELIQQIKEVINKTLYPQKFNLNEEKTKFMDKTKKIEILGIHITPEGYLTVDKHIKENIRQLLYFYLNDKDKFQDQLHTKYDGKLSKAYGSLNFINDIDKGYIVKLRKKYGNYIVDKFLHGDKSR